jgi:hypothetical protein
MTFKMAGSKTNSSLPPAMRTGREKQRSYPAASQTAR